MGELLENRLCDWYCTLKVAVDNNDGRFLPNPSGAANKSIINKI